MQNEFQFIKVTGKGFLPFGMTVEQVEAAESKERALALAAPALLAELKRLVGEAQANAGRIHFDDVQTAKALIATVE